MFQCSCLTQFSPSIGVKNIRRVNRMDAYHNSFRCFLNSSVQGLLLSQGYKTLHSNGTSHSAIRQYVTNMNLCFVSETIHAMLQIIKIGLSTRKQQQLKHVRTEYLHPAFPSSYLSPAFLIQSFGSDSKDHIDSQRRRHKFS